MPMNSPTDIWRRRNRSWVITTPVKPATRVPSRSKNAPTSGPCGLASISATEPGSRIGSPAIVSLAVCRRSLRCDSRSVTVNWVQAVSIG